MASAGHSTELDLIVVGGGPAGMMAGLLFARAGCEVMVLEKHADFFRDFRGDTVHPSTMEILDQLGLLRRFLATFVLACCPLAHRLTPRCAAISSAPSTGRTKAKLTAA